MDNAYPLDRALLRVKSEELLLKLALARYLERQREALERETAAFPAPEGDGDTAFIDRALRRLRRRTASARLRRLAGRIVTRAAVVFLALAFTLASTMAVSAEARETVKEAVYRLVFEYNERYTAVKIDHSATGAFIDPELYTWDGAYAPTYMPAEYALDNTQNAASIHTVKYVCNDKSISFVQLPATNGQVDTENAQRVEKVMVNNSEGLLVVKKGITSIHWAIGDTILYVSGTAPTQEIIDVAQSVRIIG